MWTAIKAMFGKAGSALLGTRVLIGIILALIIAIVFLWLTLQKESAYAASAKTALNTALSVNQSNLSAIDRLTSELKKTQDILAKREREKADISTKYQDLAKRLEVLKNEDAKKWMDTPIPPAILDILLRSEGRDPCAGRKDTTPSCAGT